MNAAFWEAKGMRAKRSVLIVEDDEALRETLADHLLDEHGFATLVAGTLGEAQAIIGDRDVDVVLLDVRMPDGDGRDFCTKLRRQGYNMPIIMLTGSDAEADVVRGLESGANDYVAKPFRSKELVARLRAQLRAFDETEDAAFAIGPYKFRPSAKQLEDMERKHRIKLTDKEAAILKHLYRSQARAIDRQSLLREIWGYNSAMTSHTLETHIYRLRQKMEPDPTKPIMVITESGAYRLDTAPAPARHGRSTTVW
jgi:DNA-binding response OmpR family regulator